MTDFEKRVYNLFLATTRIKQNKPYTARKSWEGFEKRKDYIYLQRLSVFFAKNPHLFRREFFEAPYEIYTDLEDSYFNLRFFSSQKALKTCTQYFKLLEGKNPDNQLGYIKQSFKFIAKFCLKHNMSIYEYPFYKTVSQNDFLKHIKEHKVSMYVTFIFPEMYQIISSMDDDEYKLYFGELDYYKYKIEFDRCKIAKNYGTKAYQKIKQFLEKKGLN